MLSRKICFSDHLSFLDRLLCRKTCEELFLKLLHNSRFDTLQFLSTVWHEPLNTERKLNIHKMSRRSPVPLLNVLYAFSLNPVFKGDAFFITIWNFFIIQIIFSISTALNKVISPNFLVWKICGNGPSSWFAQNAQKLCFSEKFLHREIRWNSVIYAVIWKQ